MDDGMVVGSTAVPQYHHNGAPRDSTDRGRCASLRYRCRRHCRCGEYGSDEPRSCTVVICRSVCSRIMLVVVNLAFLLAGWTLIGLGIWIHIFHDTLPYNALFRDNATGPLLILDRLPITLVVTGSAISIIGFLGCCGACTESVCFLGFYAVLLVLSFVAQVAIATLAISFHKQVHRNTVLSLQYQIRYEYNITAKYSNNTDSPAYKVTSTWDSLQTQLNCCGAVGPQDYYYSLWYNNTHHTQGPFVPQSCCRALRYSYDNTQCQIEAVKYVFTGYDLEHFKHQLHQHYNDRDVIPSDGSGSAGGATNGVGSEEIQGARAQGCHAAMVDWVAVYLPFVFVLLTVDVLQLMNVVCACLLIGMVRRKQVDYSWCEDQDEVD